MPKPSHRALYLSLLSTIARAAVPVLLVYISGPIVAQRRGDRVFDPPPSIRPLPPSKGNRSGTGPRPEPEGTEPPSLNGGESFVVRQLIGYGEGRYIHSNASLFTNNVAAEIRSLQHQGLTLTRMVVRGFADGLRNQGVRYAITAVPFRCRPGIEGQNLLFDRDLAFLRACLIWDDISSNLGESTRGQPAWLRDIYDIPDGGPSGPAFRKTVVEFVVSRAATGAKTTN